PLMFRKTVLFSMLTLAFPLAVHGQGAIMPLAGQSAPAQPSAAASACTNGIDYHNGPIIADPHVYFIWYGDWNGNTATTILPDFIAGLTGSRYFDTNTTYFQGDCATGQTVLNRTSLNGQVFDSYSQGGSLNDGTLINVVRNAIGS